MVLAAVVALATAAVIAWPRASPEQLRREAAVAAREGRWAQADAALARLPDPSPEDWLHRAVAALALDDERATLTDLAHIPADGPLAAQIALVTGQIERRRFRARPMEAALRKALRLDPRLVAARRLLVYLYGTQERRPELMEQFAALAEQGPLSFDLVHHWCVSRGEIGDPAEVRPDLERFVHNDPEDRWSRLALAEADRKLGHLDRAAAALEPLPADDPDARAARAQLALDRGEIAAAEDLLAKGPKEHPRLARLRGRLALVRRNGSAAVRWFRRAAAAEPDDRDTLVGLGQALRLVGDEAAAVPILRRAADLQTLHNLLVRVANQPDLPPATLCELAAACEAVGRAPEARAWYRLAIAADPLNSRAQQALFRLASADSPAKANTSGTDPPRP